MTTHTSIMKDNTLLTLNDIPCFDRLRAADIAPAMRTVMDEARSRLAALKQAPEVTWGNTVEVLTDIGERVGRVWGVIAHINSVADTPEWREAYNALIPEVTLFSRKFHKTRHFMNASKQSAHRRNLRP